MAADENATTKSYEQARELTEKALEAYVDENDKKGDKLIERAKGVDENAVQDVSDELDDDAPSEHDVVNLNDQLAKDDG
jgi:hypothetical protein